MSEIYESIARPYRAWRERRETQRLDRIAQTLVKHYGARVLQGPFAGMQYVTESYGSQLVPKLLGSYENELHDLVEQIVAQRPKIVIDIGAAEGYYAVGLAL